MKRLALLLPLLALAAGCARGPVAVSVIGSSTVSSNALRAAVGIRTIHELEWRLHERREPAAASVLSLWRLPLDSAATNAPATP